MIEFSKRKFRKFLEESRGPKKFQKVSANLQKHIVNFEKNYDFEILRKNVLNSINKIQGNYEFYLKVKQFCIS